MQYKHGFIYKFFFLFIFLFSFSSQASVVINGTRVIYPGNEKEVTVKLSNKGNQPVLVQSWIDDGDQNALPENMNVPFFLTPPINRIEPNKSQTLRISYAGDKEKTKSEESIYWLNVLEIPPAPKVNDNKVSNSLQVAFRTRIKLFYRPEAINNKFDAAKSAEELIWSIENGKLTAHNQSPYFVSLISITLGTENQQEIVDGEMIAPNQSKQFEFKNRNLVNSGNTVSYEYINDWGAVNTVNYSL
ncbi:fimbrial biogenesis chaperone [Providencia rettgeri]|uniref:fimbrial biogenesis chaperone n=1 Tax=Providencia rettgeri TaxID=587 RepID=UPI001B364EEC|nr:fimbria/pilus periplasmic chaperone [Providencia rettgeri]MBQ0368831.1 fimbria/pilus periplasmic chaperone [Providencia rettgeri]